MKRLHERGGHLFAALVVFLAAAGCGRPAGPIEVTLVPAKDKTPAFVRVTGLSSKELAAFKNADAAQGWNSVLSVAVTGNDALPVAGTRVAGAEGLEFHPRFPFDSGRSYTATFDPSRMPVSRPDPKVVASIVVPAGPEGAATAVSSVSPGNPVWPENTLRFYIHFSGPMSRTSALGHVRLEDDAGRDVKEPFLPLDVDLWNGDRTRFTVFFDPGRVKRGIRPNVELGRALIAGGKYAIVVDAAWPDAAGRPLRESLRYAFTAGPAEERAVAPSAWRVTPPAPDTRDALAVAFPWPLDRGLLQRAIGVTNSSGEALVGNIAIDEHERQWRFVPREPWRAGGYQLVVLTLLEDPAGNRVGRPFEIEMFQKPAVSAEEKVTVPFQVGAPK